MILHPQNQHEFQLYQPTSKLVLLPVLLFCSLSMKLLTLHTHLQLCCPSTKSVNTVLLLILVPQTMSYALIHSSTENNALNLENLMMAPLALLISLTAEESWASFYCPTKLVTTMVDMTSLKSLLRKDGSHKTTDNNLMSRQIPAYLKFPPSVLAISIHLLLLPRSKPIPSEPMMMILTMQLLMPMILVEPFFMSTN